MRTFVAGKVTWTNTSTWWDCRCSIAVFSQHISTQRPYVLHLSKNRFVSICNVSLISFCRTETKSYFTRLCRKMWKSWHPLFTHRPWEKLVKSMVSFTGNQGQYSSSNKANGVPILVPRILLCVLLRASQKCFFCRSLHLTKSKSFAGVCSSRSTTLGTCTTYYATGPSLK